MTLVEVMISLGLLVVCGVSGIYSFMLLNRYAARERAVSSAKALCQERIEQALTMSFRPPATLPVVNCQNSSTYNLLGSSSNYTSGGIYIGAETYTEPVTVYVQQDPASATSISGTRTTTVTPAPLADTNGGVLGVVQLAVTVAYTINGENRTYQMWAMRSSDN